MHVPCSAMKILKPGYCCLLDNYCCFASEKRRGSGGPAPAPEEVITVEVPEVPLRELNGITASFSGEKLIGQGSYAKVYQATTRSGRLAVVKRLEKPSKHASNDVFLKQLGVASRLKHDNFVRLLGYTISGDLRVLVYEFATMGTLHDVLHGGSPSPLPCCCCCWWWSETCIQAAATLGPTTTNQPRTQGTGMC